MRRAKRRSTASLPVEATIKWFLPERVRERHLTPPRLGRALRAGGYTISDSAVYRLLQYPPKRFNRELLAALCRSLDCTIAELLEYDRLADIEKALPDRFTLPGT